MLQFAQELCKDITGSQCSPPRVSSWRLVDPGQANVSVDLLDAATLGLGSVVPANVKGYGSYFTSGLERKTAAGGMSASISGYGAGGGISGGWSLPFVGAQLMGNTTGIKQKVLEALGNSAQGRAMDLAKGSGWGGGTQLIAGPDAKGDLVLSDFHEMYAVVCSLGANFVVNGVACGIIIMSKKQPVLSSTDVIYARAIGLMASVGLSVSLDIEVSNMVYQIKVGR